jgi:zinc protease
MGSPNAFSTNLVWGGLRVIISEDHYAPVYAICEAYKVGSKDERPGRTGFAHLFEHMMFKARRTWAWANWTF